MTRQHLPFPQVLVSGSATERGRRYGSLARARVLRSVEAYRRVFLHWAEWDWSRVTREAKRFVDPIADFRPSYLHEMQGIADGAGIDFEDVLALNVRSEVMFAGRVAREPTLVPLECSAFASVPRSGEKGDVLLGQNWDWLLHSSGTVVLLVIRQDEAPDLVTLVEAGLLAKTGLNAAGLGLVTNALVSEEDVGAPGIPYHVLLRALLETESVGGARAIAATPVRSSSANYLVADAAGLVVDIEAVPGDGSCLVEFPPVDGTLVHTNHFLHKASSGEDITLRLAPFSPDRMARLGSSISELRRPHTVESLFRMLADHEPPESPVCSHADDRRHPLERTATIASIVMDLSARRGWMAGGNPCTHAFTEVPTPWSTKAAS